MTSSDIVTTFVQWLYLVVFHVIPSILLPVFNAQRVPVRIVFGVADQECASGIVSGHEQFLRFFTGNFSEEPTIARKSTLIF